MKKSITIILILLISFATSALAGPFGLSMGMPLKDISKNAKKIENGLYKLTDVPKPHSAFEYYVIQVSPKNGLCWIKGIGKDISTSSYGTQLRSEFERFTSKLEERYGAYKNYDFLSNGSIWDESNDFMMGLVKKDRYLQSFWDREKGSVMPADITGIALSAKASNSDTGYIVLEYSFSNEEQCEKELAAKEDGAL